MCLKSHKWVPKWYEFNQFFTDCFNNMGQLNELNSSGFYLTWLQGSCELLVKNNCNMFYWPNFLVNLNSTSSNTRVILWEYLGSNVNDISLKNKQKFRQTQNPTEKETTLVVVLKYTHKLLLQQELQSS